MDLADGTPCLLDEFQIGLAGRRPSYRSNISAINLNNWHIIVPTGKSSEVRIGINPPRSKLWVRRDVAAVPKVTAGPDKILQITNVGTHELVLNMVPRWHYGCQET